MKKVLKSLSIYCFFCILASYLAIIAADYMSDTMYMIFICSMITATMGWLAHDMTKEDIKKLKQKQHEESEKNSINIH